MDTEQSVMNGAGGGDEQKTPQYITAEDLKSFGESLASKLESKFRSDEGRVPHLQSQVNKLLEMVGNTGGNTETKESTIDPKEEVKRLLQEDRARLEAEKQSLNRQRIRSTLESSLAENGANPSAIKLAADSLMMRNADKLEISSNDLGESKIVFRDSEFSEPITVNDFIKGFLQSQEGSAIVQQKKSPYANVPGGRPPVAGEIIKMTRAEAATADPKLLKSGRVVFVD